MDKTAAEVWIGVAFAVALGLAAAVFVARGIDAESIKLALRVTARWSFLVFWLAYAGGSIATLCGPGFASLGRRSREFGLAFAASHLIHLILVVWLYRLTHRPPLGGMVFVIFAAGTLWTYTLAALSFKAPSRALGPSLRNILRAIGVNYILLAFAFDFVRPVIHFHLTNQGFWPLAEYLPFAVMNIAAPLLRLTAAAYRRLETRQLVAGSGPGSGNAAEASSERAISVQPEWSDERRMSV